MAKYLIKIQKIDEKHNLLKTYCTLPIIAVDIDGAWQKAVDFYEIATQMDTIEFLRFTNNLSDYDFKDHKYTIKDNKIFAEVDEYIEGGRIREYFIDSLGNISEE